MHVTLEQISSSSEQTESSCSHSTRCSSLKRFSKTLFQCETVLKPHRAYMFLKQL